MGIISWLKKVKLDQKIRAMQDTTRQVSLGFDGKVQKVQKTSETDTGKLYRQLAQNVCPDCGSTDGFFEGPRGGISQNIYCMNPKCTQGFNITEMIGIADRIGKGKDRFPEWWEPTVPAPKEQHLN